MTRTDFVPVLETQRLRLRGWKEEDLDLLAEWSADEETMRYIGRGNTMNRAQTWNSLAWLAGHWVLKGYGEWAVTLRESGRLIGRIGLIYPEGWPDLELVWLLDRGYRGHGYATEAAAAARDFAFRELGADRLISLFYPQNEASMRVSQRVGESLVGEVDVFGMRLVCHEMTRSTWLRRVGDLET